MIKYAKSLTVRLVFLTYIYAYYCLTNSKEIENAGINFSQELQYALKTRLHIGV